MKVGEIAFFFVSGTLVGALFISVCKLLTEIPLSTIISNYQDFIVGLLTLSAAAATIYYLHRQENLTKEKIHNDAEVARKTALASLAISLSRICGYADACMKIALRLRNAIDNQVANYGGEKIPQIPENIITSLSIAAGHLDKNIGTKIADILNCYQVQCSRLKGYMYDYIDPESTTIVTRHNASGAMEDAAALLILAEELFSHARQGRRATDSIPEDKLRSTIEFHLSLPTYQR